MSGSAYRAVFLDAPQLRATVATLLRAWSELARFAMPYVSVLINLRTRRERLTVGYRCEASAVFGSLFALAESEEKSRGIGRRKLIRTSGRSRRVDDRRRQRSGSIKLTERAARPSNLAPRPYRNLPARNAPTAAFIFPKRLFLTRLAHNFLKARVITNPLKIRVAPRPVGVEPG